MAFPINHTGKKKIKKFLGITRYTKKYCGGGTSSHAIAVRRKIATPYQKYQLFIGDSFCH